MKGAFPPSSNETRLSCALAPAMSRLPTSVDPVKAIFRTAGWSRNTWPITLLLLPVTTLNTPAGSPASAQMVARASAVSGVALAGFRTTAQPAARAGAILRVTIVAGEIHGVIAATTPNGCRITPSPLPGTGGGANFPSTQPAPPPQPTE